ncbi:hypothetical protein L1049_006382 [Liquidambar formosana]|uniref:Uncharacterized protein n=1 Tax=Liquidambar formosana TaxID=63359 RepID=A0AAP0RH54_LIQFO
MHSCTKMCDHQPFETPSPTFLMKNLSEKFDHSISTQGENCGIFYSDDDKLSPLFLSIDEQTLQSELTLRTQALSMENHENSPPSDGTQSYNEGNHKNSPSATVVQAFFEDDHWNSPSGVETLNSLEENYDKIPLGNARPNACLGDEQTSDDELPIKCQNFTEKEEKSRSDSTPLTLITCSVMCVPLYDGQIHVNNKSIRSPKNDTPLVDSSIKSFNSTFIQQTYNCKGDQR